MTNFTIKMSDLVWFLEKSTLNPDLPYNRLLYKRFLLYILFSVLKVLFSHPCYEESGRKVVELMYAFHCVSGRRLCHLANTRTNNALNRPRLCLLKAHGNFGQMHQNPQNCSFEHAFTQLFMSRIDASTHFSF